MVIISKLGLHLTVFPDESHFLSYLRLAPNLSISPDKKGPGNSKATICTRAAKALQVAALTLKNSITALGAFYRRVSRRKGASVAVFATARKLAQLIYRLVCYGQTYVDVGQKAYEGGFNQRRLNVYTKILKGMGYNPKRSLALS